MNFIKLGGTLIEVEAIIALAPAEYSGETRILLSSGVELTTTISIDQILDQIAEALRERT